MKTFLAHVCLNSIFLGQKLTNFRCQKCSFSHFCVATEPVWKVARYTSAAPLYFTELDNYIDGGVLANNPCGGGLAKIQSWYMSKNQRIPIACLVSVGSGLFPPNPLGTVSIFGVRNLLRMLSDAVSTECVCVYVRLSIAVNVFDGYELMLL